jgi:hypothetical protein
LDRYETKIRNIVMRKAIGLCALRRTLKIMKANVFHGKKKMLGTNFLLQL